MDKSEIYILGYDFEKISRYLFEIADEYRKSVDYNFEPDHMSERTQMCITEILDEFQMVRLSISFRSDFSLFEYTDSCI